jgi:hypothetical protein
MPVITKPLIAFVVGIVAGGSGYVSYDYYHRLDGSRPPSSTTDRHPPVAAAATEPAKGLKCDVIETIRETTSIGDEVPEKVKNSTMVVKLLNDTQWEPLYFIEEWLPLSYNVTELLPLRTTNQTYVLLDNETSRNEIYVKTITLSVNRITGNLYGLFSRSSERLRYFYTSTITGRCQLTSLKPIL